MFTDYYSVLNISPNSTIEDIKTAYRNESLKWHPDKNLGVDTTKQMQIVNEAYAILKDKEKRCRYDAEYVRFKRVQTDTSSSNKTRGAHASNGCQGESSTSYSDWMYEYDVKDETLKEDIKQSRAYAKELVDRFVSSLKQSAKDAANGAWFAVKPYLIWLIIVLLIGIIIPFCSGLSGACDDDLCLDSVGVAQTSNIPGHWNTYEMDNVYRISLPPTVEIRKNADEYTQELISHNLYINNNIITFQQKGLSKIDKESLNTYCRIMLQYEHGAYGNFMNKNQTTYFNKQLVAELKDLVSTIIGPYCALIGKFDYCWKDVNGTKYIEVKYKRTGVNFDATAPVVCKMCIFQNNSEIVMMCLSYKEKDAHLWANDFDLIPNSFMWL